MDPKKTSSGARHLVTRENSQVAFVAQFGQEQGGERQQDYLPFHRLLLNPRVWYANRFRLLFLFTMINIQGENIK